MHFRVQEVLKLSRSSIQGLYEQQLISRIYPIAHGHQSPRGVCTWSKKACYYNISFICRQSNTSKSSMPDQPVHALPVLNHDRTDHHTKRVTLFVPIYTNATLQRATIFFDACLSLHSFLLETCIIFQIQLRKPFCAAIEISDTFCYLP